MHSSLILLFVFSVILVILMITCFICFIRSRKKEELEFLQQVQYTSRQNQQQQEQQQQQHQHQQQHRSHSPKLNTSPSNNLMINDSSVYQGEPTSQSHQQQQQHHHHHQQQQQQQQQAQIMADYAAGVSRTQNPYGQAEVSPYHKQQGQVSPRATETRSDITQQINSAIIGSSEAEFQNDFIQVFPMYQIAPMPEKNTTPYLT